MLFGTIPCGLGLICRPPGQVFHLCVMRGLFIFKLKVLKVDVCSLPEDKNGYYIILYFASILQLHVGTDT